VRRLELGSAVGGRGMGEKGERNLGVLKWEGTEGGVGEKEGEEGERSGESRRSSGEVQHHLLSTKRRTRGMGVFGVVVVISVLPVPIL